MLALLTRWFGENTKNDNLEHYHNEHTVSDNDLGL